MQLGELPQELNQRSFAERMIRGGVECNRGETRGEVLDVSSLEKEMSLAFDHKTSELTVTQFGTKSHLLMTNTTCLCDFSFLTYSRTDSQMVPSGSRASRMWRMTSEESMTLYSSPYIRREVPLA